MLSSGRKSASLKRSMTLPHTTSTVRGHGSFQRRENLSVSSWLQSLPKSGKPKSHTDLTHDDDQWLAVTNIVLVPKIVKDYFGHCPIGSADNSQYPQTFSLYLPSHSSHLSSRFNPAILANPVYLSPSVPHQNQFQKADYSSSVKVALC